MKVNFKIGKLLLVAVILTMAALVMLCAVAISRYGDGHVAAYEATESAENTATEHGVRNVLFMGFDDEAGLCDVMMLISLNSGSKSAAIAQIPRDSYAKYTDASYKKLNGAYSSLGGAAEVADFLGGAMGIDIHHYVCIDLNTLGNIVDAMGGVDIELPCNMYYVDEEQGLYIDLKKGSAHLDGDTAQQFVRFRSGYANGDLGRIDAQKLFMAAVFSKLCDEFSPVMGAKLMAAADGVETDLSVAELMSLGVGMLEIKAENIYLMTLPGKQATALQSGASYYVIAAEPTAEIMARFFGRTAEFDADRVFLNSRYQEFSNIYFSNMEYTAIPIKDVF